MLRNSVRYSTTRDTGSTTATVRAFPTTLNRIPFLGCGSVRLLDACRTRRLHPVQRWCPVDVGSTHRVHRPSRPQLHPRRTHQQSSRMGSRLGLAQTRRIEAPCPASQPVDEGSNRRRSRDPELGGVSVQWTNTIMDFAAEFRFFVVDGDAVTGSPYLVDGVADHSAGRSWSRYADAHAVARDFAVALAGSSPRALVLDIGWDRTRRGWFIVEANRPWSSGLYGCDPDEVAAVIEVSMCDDSRWEWKPDPVVWSYAETLRPVSGTRLSSGLWLV